MQSLRACEPEAELPERHAPELGFAEVEDVGDRAERIRPIPRDYSEDSEGSGDAS
jgi:hypothetical protein